MCSLTATGKHPCAAAATRFTYGAAARSPHMQRCGGGYRELPGSLFEELAQSHRTIDELRRQLERQQSLIAERSLEISELSEVLQRVKEKEGSAAHALVQAQLAFADKVALWNERLQASQEGAVQQQEATQVRGRLAASQRQVGELQARVAKLEAEATESAARGAALAGKLTQARQQAEAERAVERAVEQAAMQELQERSLAWMEAELRRRVEDQRAEMEGNQRAEIEAELRRRTALLPLSTPVAAEQPEQSQPHQLSSSAAIAVRHLAALDPLAAQQRSQQYEQQQQQQQQQQQAHAQQAQAEQAERTQRAACEAEAAVEAAQASARRMVGAAEAEAAQLRRLLEMERAEAGATRRRAEAEAEAVAERAAAEVERAGAERLEAEARLRGEAERAHAAARDEAWKWANSRRNLGAQLAALAQESTAAKQVSSPPPSP